MTDTKGLEVVGWRIGFPNGAGYKVYGTPQPWAHEQYGVPAVTLYDVQELCRISDANAMIDQIKADAYIQGLKDQKETFEKAYASSDFWAMCESKTSDGLRAMDAAIDAAMAGGGE